MSNLTFRDRLIPWYFVAFFLVILAVNGIMVTLAVRSSTGTVTDHPYEKGLAYNDIITAEKAQEHLGWKAVISLKGTTLHVVLNDANGRLLTPEKITARFMRPTQSGMDFEITLNHGTASVTIPAKGLWEIRIFATVNGTAYQQSKRVVIE